MARGGSRKTVNTVGRPRATSLKASGAKAVKPNVLVRGKSASTGH